MCSATIVDARGMPLGDDRPDAYGSTLDFSTHGVPGLRQSGGVINEERLPRLMGRKAALLYREMADNCPITGFVLQCMKTWIGAAQWSVKAAGDSFEAQQAAWFLQSCMDDMSGTWDNFIQQGLSCIEYGYSYFEVLYKRRLGGNGDDPLTKSAHNDGYIGWRKFAFRSQDTLDRWGFDANGSLNGMYQQMPEGAAYNVAQTGGRGRFFVPLRKALLFRLMGYNDNPEGRSVLRNAVTSYLDKRRIGDIEMIGVERDLAGLPYMQLPEMFFDPKAPAWVKQAREAWKQVVSMIRRDQLEGITGPCELNSDGKPTGYKLQLLTSGGERQLDVDKITRRKESRIAMSCMAEFCLVGIEQGGGFDGGGVMDSKKDAFSLSLSAVPRSMAAVLNHFAVKPLMRVNGFDPSVWPTLEHTDVAGPTLTELAQYVAALSAAGMLMYDAATEAHLRQEGGLPQRDGTEIGGNQITGMTQPQGQTTRQEAEGSGIPQDSNPTAPGTTGMRQAPNGVLTNA